MNTIQQAVFGGIMGGLITIAWLKAIEERKAPKWTFSCEIETHTEKCVHDILNLENQCPPNHQIKIHSAKQENKILTTAYTCVK